LQSYLVFLLVSLFTTTLTAARPSDPGDDKCKAPGIPIKLNQHFSTPSSGLNTMGVYSTNFGETPYCCPFSPKKFEVDAPCVTNGTNNGGWGIVPIICQVSDAGQNGVFNAAGTVLLGDSWVLYNGSVTFYGHAGSRNGPYYFGFAMDLDRKNVSTPNLWSSSAWSLCPQSRLQRSREDKVHQILRSFR
jgi:hypothetical protein